MTILAAIKIKVENEENLSNGDKIKVTVNVDQEKTKKIKGGTKEFKVSGLDEPKKLSTEAAEKHLVPVFSGVSGRGTVKFENTFSDELRNVYFTAKNNGKLSNGDEVELEIDDSFKKSLIHHGYVLDETFEPKYKVKNLHVVADQAKDIANLEDIKRIINEEMQKQYGKSFIYSYKVKHENYMYRKFEPGEVDASKWTESGNLVGLYTVSRYSGDNLDSQYVVVRGFKNIYLDKNNKANIADIMRNKINQSMDSSYSLETVVQMYEGYGYEIIE